MVHFHGGKLNMKTSWKMATSVECELSIFELLAGKTLYGTLCKLSRTWAKQ
jgi:hypothetical protein